MNPRLDVGEIFPAVTVTLSAWICEEGYLDVCRRCGAYWRNEATPLLEIDQRQILAASPRYPRNGIRRRSHRWFCSASAILSIIRSARGCDCASRTDEWTLKCATIDMNALVHERRCKPLVIRDTFS